MPRDIETLTGAELDRELQSLLDVAPSGDFVARVRLALASATAPRRWWQSWPAAAAASAALAALVVASLLPGGRPAARPEMLPARLGNRASGQSTPVPAAPQTTAIQRDAASADVPGTVRRARVRTLDPRRQVPPPAPEILVSADDVRGYRALVDRPEILTMTIVSGVVASLHETTEIAPMNVVPIVVPPIGGARQGGSE